MSFPNLVKAVAPTTYSVSGSGEPWVNPASAADTSEASNAYLGSSSWTTSQLLLVKGFDFSWFDTANYDCTGMTVFIKHNGIAVGNTEFSNIQLYDASGAAFGPNVGASVTASGISWTAVDIVTSVPAATLTSSSFGIGFTVTNVSGSGSGGIYYVEMVPRFTRKVTHTGNYGLQMIDAVGTNKLTDASTFVRLVNVTHKDGGFTGTVSIPDFDDTKGVMYFVAEIEKVNTSDVQQPRTALWASDMLMAGHGMELPSINWDNTTKIMTVSTGGAYPLVSGFEGWPMTCGWAVTTVHYR